MKLKTISKIRSPIACADDIQRRSHYVCRIPIECASIEDYNYDNDFIIAALDSSCRMKSITNKVDALENLSSRHYKLVLIGGSLLE